MYAFHHGAPGCVYFSARVLFDARRGTGAPAVVRGVIFVRLFECAVPVLRPAVFAPLRFTVSSSGW
jgi:hypothetical protein